MGTATKDHLRREQTAEEEPEPGPLDRFLRAIAPPTEWTEAHSRL